MSRPQLSAPVISIDAEDLEPITVKLVGELYAVAPAKVGSVLRMMSTAESLDLDNLNMRDAVGPFRRVLEEWVVQAFGDQAQEVMRRLEDPRDALDYPHIAELFSAVMDYSKKDGVEENPTTSGSDS